MLRIIHFLLLACAFLLGGPLLAEPKPGEVFREFVFPHWFWETDPKGTYPGNVALRAGSMASRSVDLWELKGAMRAEVSIEYRGGHPGKQRFQVNGGNWLGIPQSTGAPQGPINCYYRNVLGRSSMDIPLRALKDGANLFKFTAGPQMCAGFGFGHFWIYSFTVRLYYAPGSRPHPSGSMISPAMSATMGDFPRLIADARGHGARISRVDFLANCEGYDWNGDGVWKQWQYAMERGVPMKHAGSAFELPYAVTWDTAWLPDQSEPIQIAARITDSLGMTYITPAVSVQLKRPGRSVRMHRVTGFPEQFGASQSRTLQAAIPIPGDLQTARMARLVFTSWSAAHADSLLLNGKPVATRTSNIHNYSFDEFDLPMSFIQKGENIFSLRSDTKDHAAEVNWPGAAILVEYGPPPLRPAADAAWWHPAFRRRLLIEVNPDGVARLDKPVEVSLNLANLQLDAGSARWRVVEIGAAGEVTNDHVPFQFNPDPDRQKGTLILLAEGEMGRTQRRRFHLYQQAEASAPVAPRVADRLQLEDNVPFEGQASFRVKSANATYLYHKEGAGFAGLQDLAGLEWLGYHPGNGPAGEYRGIPNLGFNFGHPGYKGETGSDSRIEASGPLHIRVLSERHDRKWAARWDFFPGYARMTMLKNDKPYWYLYEGTPAGELSLERGFHYTSDGHRHSNAESWGHDLKAPEWVFFGDAKVKRTLFLANHDDDDAPDQYWPMEGKMTVFGFGRAFRFRDQYLNRAPAQLTIGLLETDDFNEAAMRIESAWRPLTVQVEEPQARP